MPNPTLAPVVGENYLPNAGAPLLPPQRPPFPPDPPEPPDPPVPPILQRCRPKILIVCDVGLSYLPSGSAGAFGLWRFVHAITAAAGVTLMPAVTLAHRGAHAPAAVAIGSTNYPILQNFKFDATAPTMDVSHYDQVWIFGFSGPAPSAAEMQVLATFMNKGGGVFATGDHGVLGKALCGDLPRIRHMREWAKTPMGTEAESALAVQRIDTISSPGQNTAFEFEDQSDMVPQRIYPKYTVRDLDGLGGTLWEASVHPLLALPGASLVRRSDAAGGANLQFQSDVDVLPDHAHESVCYEFSGAAVPSGNYAVGGQNFVEFPMSAAAPGVRVGSDAVAYGVSGGRTVFNGVWKPPVQPQMFRLISAFNGQLAQPYPGNTMGPGRIVCDSTWHHFLNINLDGSGTNRQGLGTWSFGTPGLGVFTPSADLNKIYAYFRNIVSWLQPPNRIWCRLLTLTLSVATNPALAEELVEAPKLTNWSQLVALGQQARGLLAAELGGSALDDIVQTALLEHPATRAQGQALATGALHGSGIHVQDLAAGTLGGLILTVVEHFPDVVRLRAATPEQAAAAHETLEQRLRSRLPELWSIGLSDQERRATKTRSAATQHLSSLRAAVPAT